MSFKDNSTTEFSNNRAGYSGGAISTYDNSHLSFKHNSTTEFSNNRADYDGGAILAGIISHVSFEDNSTTEFNNNRADYGGAISGYNNSHVLFEDHSTTEFSNNRAVYVGGAISTYICSHVSFKDNSTTEFSNNRVDDDGGAIYAYYNSHVSFKDNSTTEFSNNRAYGEGGAIYSYYSSIVSFEDSSATIFSNNNALSNNNAITFRKSGHIMFDGNCNVSLINNKSTDGGIVYPISSIGKCEITARGNSTITFNDQSAKWCANACLPYSGEDFYDVRIDNTSVIWCRNQSNLICHGRNCQCKNLEEATRDITNNSLLTLSDNVRLSSAFNLNIFQNISIIGQNNPIVICVNGGGLQLEHCNNLTIQDITWIGCKTALKIYNSKDVTIRSCSFLHSTRQIIAISEASGNVNVDYCKFMYNYHYRGHGSAIHYSSNKPSTSELT